MMVYENKEYYTTRELADRISDAAKYGTEEFARLWILIFGSKNVWTSTVQYRLTPLVRAKKLKHLECSKNSARVYYFYNIEDIIDCLKNLSAEESTTMVNNFSSVKLVEAE